MISSIFKIDLQVSVAKLNADNETKRGCTTSSSTASAIPRLFIEIPAFLSPSLCFDRSSVTVSMGFRAAFSANV